MWHPCFSDFLEPPVPRIQYTNKFVGVPVVQVVQFPQMQTYEKIVATLESFSGPDTQTAESLGPTPVRHVTFAETVERVETLYHLTLPIPFLRCV